MNGEGSSILLRKPAPMGNQTYSAHAAVPREIADEQSNSTDQREMLLMVALWLFIGLVAAYDTYLSIKYQETLRFQELNPIGRWLLEFDGGSVATFMGCKFLGTSIVLGVLQFLYMYSRRLGLTVATALASLQAMLALYLTFG